MGKPSLMKSEDTVFGTSTEHRLKTFAAHLAALVIGAGTAAAGFTILIGDARTYPAAFVLTLIASALLGVPTYLVLSRSNRANWWTAIAAGFVVGAIVPAFLLLPRSGADQASIGGVATVINGSYTAAGWRQVLLFVAGFGLLGSIGALLFWTSINWLRGSGSDGQRQMPNRFPQQLRGIGLGLCAVAFTGAALAIPEVTRDRSCHNTLRNGGDSIAAVAIFDLKVGPAHWSRVENIVQKFGADGGWSILSTVRPADEFKWFQMSLCREPGTEISVNGIVQFGTVSIAATQPQGGTSWRAPFAKLLEQIEAEWPGSVEFTGPQGQKIPRPEWATTPPKTPS